MQEIPAESLVWNDSTCPRAYKPGHNDWAWALEPKSYNYWDHMPKLLKPESPRTHALQQKKPRKWEAYTPQLELPWLATSREKPVQ